jgi:YHS domain-containing protein
MLELNRRRVLLLATVTAVLPISGGGPYAGENGLALRGYDPVSYFTAGRPEKGSSEFAFTYEDTIYNFVSSEHRDMFKSDPEKYAPQFSGYCAIGVSMGMKVTPDPDAWIIADGKLYVFSSKDGVATFKGDVITAANRKWDDLRGKN